MKKDRNAGYIPDWGQGVSRPGSTFTVEIGRPFQGLARTGEAAYGLADELNRERRWMWAEVSGARTFRDPDEDAGIDISGVEHWARFDGHRIQVDITLSTHNEREVNQWKGRDEVRRGGTWSIALNRYPVYGGWQIYDPLETLLTIRDVTKRLLGHPAFHQWTLDEIEALVGRRVYYGADPAIISGQSLEAQGRIILTPDGTEYFAQPPWFDDAADEAEEGSIATDLLDDRIWWWRDE
jgi:hypothetical protein